MKNQIISLRIAGVISLLFTLFHFAFQKLFQWDQSLACLTQSDRAILLTYHYASILISGFMAFVLLFQTAILLRSQLKYTILVTFAAFYTIRIVTEFVHFGIQMPHSLIIIIMCAIPAILLMIPLFQKTNSHAD